MTAKQKQEVLLALRKAEEEVQALTWALENGQHDKAGRALTAFLAWLLAVRSMVEAA